MQTTLTKSGLNPANFSGKVDNKEVHMYVLTNDKGAEVTVINCGAKIVSLSVPDKNGKLTDVVLGQSSLDEYLNSEEPYFGAVCGRTANRIANGQFTLDGVVYKLAVNNGPNNLHGGLKGFNSVVWDAKQVDSQTLELSYTSKDGEEGFPGNLDVTITYCLTNENALKINYEAKTDKATIINLTNHSYFNLSGEGDPSINDHVLVMHASKYLPTDNTAIPYGKAEEVKGTPFDFTTPHTIGERIEDDFEQLHFGKGYDHTMVLDKFDGGCNLAIECYSPKTGIQMDVLTTEPGVQMYTGNWMTGNLEGKHGHRYPSRAAVCFETQHFPDSINKPEYPSVILRPGEIFKSETVFAFSIKG
ncbi:galactose mutarotase [Dysgonomonas sp. Marseille-P4677]|uniref:aldose epimerase family protein n=1 Tax=Dysgonomonas sp. Marseille-P4677 TaxID=2364790 RepID=UPI001911BD72|nr:aldose epimerase family protein [Dysgonomonas sp. Marseille-P4677]MBK5719401.1 galactose mutarotase [Dysgonomonas sp. Marseille-P4677]